MKTCYKCGKTLGVMSTKFVCRNCGKTFCFQCMVKIDIPAEIASLFNLTNEFTKPEWSLRKMSYVYCPVCAAKFNDSKNRLFLANSHLDEDDLYFTGLKESDCRDIISEKEYKNCSEEIQKIASNGHIFRINIEEITDKEKLEEKWREFINKLPEDCWLRGK